MDQGRSSNAERVFIGLGTNLEPRLEHLKSAVAALHGLGAITRVSSVYETAPIGGVPQPDYLNAVAELQTALDPLELVTRLKEIEKNMGRKDRPRWHEREIDLDVLFYGELIFESPTLTVPHSELHRRAFVLVPIAEIAPDFLHPVMKKSVSELLRGVDASGVTATTFTL